MAYISESVSIARVKTKPRIRTRGAERREEEEEEGRTHGRHRRRRNEDPIDDGLVYVDRRSGRGPRAEEDRRHARREGKRRTAATTPLEEPEVVRQSGRPRELHSGRRRSESDARIPPSYPPPTSARRGRREPEPNHRGVEATIRRSQSTRHVRSRPTEPAERPTILRTAFTREPSHSKPRPTLRRSNTTTNQLRPASAHASLPTMSSLPGPRAEKQHPSTSSPHERRRASGLFSAFFGMPQGPRVPEKKVECLTCLSDDIPVSKSAKLACGHIMCHDCLKRIFVLSVSDPQHMPPRCCTRDHIPLKHVDKLFNVKFKMQWNRKYQEYTTKNRIYCPSKGCGEWIKPANIHLDEAGSGRKYGKCSRCKTKVCCLCNGKWHGRKECPKDDETNAFVEIAKREGWQRCHNCSAMVELKEGCNHMTCRCTAEFCMICGAKWKTCNCPWFNYNTVEHDRLNHFNIAMPRAAAQEAPGDPLGYQQEVDRRRRQVEQDERLARRLQALNIDLNGRRAELFDRAHAHHPHPFGIPRGNPFQRPPGLAGPHAAGGAHEPDVRGHRADASPDQRREFPPAAGWPLGGGGPRGEDMPARLRPQHTNAPPPPARAAERAGAPRSPYVERLTEEYDTPSPRDRLRRSTTRVQRPGGHESRRLSTLAGLTRSEGPGGRVGAWLQHVVVDAPPPEFRPDDLTARG